MFHCDPFAVRARQDQSGVVKTQRLERAEHLGLFAAHHIEHAVFFDAQARHDGDATRAVVRYPA